MRIALIRQRPSIGDALLLAPLCREIKQAHPGATLTVLTDSNYAAGALPKIFEGNPWVDRIECVPMTSWTTETNFLINPVLRGMVNEEAPLCITKADKVYDCNAAFMLYEREHMGMPPEGIAQFWLRHHGFDPDAVNCRPVYNIQPDADKLATQWIESRDLTRPLVGVVLRAGAPQRDWNYDNKASTICDYLYCRGFTPVTFDASQGAPSVYAVACVGQPIDVVAALLHRCQVVVTPDTGLLHLAQAVGTRTLALWGIMEPRLRLDGYNTTLVPKQSLGYCGERERGSCRCAPTFQRWSCMRRITPAMVCDGLNEVLN
jgi:ADP-heptose:LPS heptosyltransferase